MSTNSPEISQQSTIRLERIWQLIYFPRSFRVYIDTHHRGRIGAGKSKTYPLDPGFHTVQVKIDFSSSQVLPVSLKSGETYSLRCGLNLLNLFDFDTDNLLILEPVDLNSPSEITTGIAHWLLILAYFIFILATVIFLFAYPRIIALVILTITLIFLIRFLQRHQIIYIISEGMSPTLKKNDRLVVRKQKFQPQRGDIILFSSQIEGRFANSVSRIIGLPGEEIAIQNGRLLINGEPLTESYIAETEQQDWESMVIPTESYFVLGDNRNSCRYDSRTLGVVSQAKILGRVVRINWPLNRNTRIDQVIYPDSYS